MKEHISQEQVDLIYSKTWIKAVDFIRLGSTAMTLKRLVDRGLIATQKRTWYKEYYKKDVLDWIIQRRERLLERIRRLDVEGAEEYKGAYMNRYRISKFAGMTVQGAVYAVKSGLIKSEVIDGKVLVLKEHVVLYLKERRKSLEKELLRFSLPSNV